MKSDKRAIFDKILRRENFISPPYFSGKFDCDDCEAVCINACDKDLLKFDGKKVKFMPNEKGCDFCRKCAVSCENSKHLTLSLKFPAKIHAIAEISVNACLAWNSVVCYNCFDICKFKAIEYFGVFRPVINNKCVGCAECIGSCFKNAITLKAEI